MTIRSSGKIVLPRPQPHDATSAAVDWKTMRDAVVICRCGEAFKAETYKLALTAHIAHAEAKQ